MREELKSSKNRHTAGGAKSPFWVKFWICLKLNQTLTWGFSSTLTKFGEEISLRSRDTAFCGRSQRAGEISKNRHTAGGAKSPFWVKFWICLKLKQTLTLGFSSTLTKFGGEISLCCRDTAFCGRS